MRILIVCSGNAPGFDFKKHQAFIYDQTEALKKLDDRLEFDYFFIDRKGLAGYLSCLSRLEKQLRQTAYHSIHAHVAMSAMLANFQRRVPVITTFHGSDINVRSSRMLAVLVTILSRETIYISQKLAEKAIYAPKKKQHIIPCGVDFSLFMSRSRCQSRQQMGLDTTKKYVLFSSAFGVPVKNYLLARAAVDLLQDETIELLELANYTRHEVALLMSAVDVALLTSFSEGSPQFVKEALACNCPVVSTDVGDVRMVMGRIPGCYITSFDPVDVADKIRRVLEKREPVMVRDEILQFDNRIIARKIRDIYQRI